PQKSTLNDNRALLKEVIYWLFYKQMFQHIPLPGNDPTPHIDKIVENHSLDKWKSGWISYKCFEGVFNIELWELRKRTK
ncbi:hypothetical protein, partial [Evansella tamaricis]|uniref:hypothetical protein n=1 Tax=Evansella tamaricis TaxID=2069301 RepID=UPI003639D3C7